jgi:dTDP-4-amino-4,6-dideoxygalactose transaminase
MVLPFQSPEGYSAYHLYVVRLNTDESRRQVFDAMRDANIGVNVHYIPVHTQPYYQKIGIEFGAFPEAERYYSEAMSLPMYFDLKDDEQDYVVNTLREILR